MDGDVKNLKPNSDSDNGNGNGNSSNNNNKPLSANEIAELRVILKGRERFRWLHSTIRLWASYISGGLVTLYIIWDYVHKFIQKLFP